MFRGNPSASSVSAFAPPPAAGFVQQREVVARVHVGLLRRIVEERLAPAVAERAQPVDRRMRVQPAASVRFAAATIFSTLGRYFISSRNSGMWVS